MFHIERGGKKNIRVLGLVGIFYGKICLYNYNMIKSPISYVGSKRRELEIIKENEPPNFTKIVDAFGGGGSVALGYLNSLEKVIYNDLFYPIANLFNILKSEEETQKLIDDYNNLPIDKETFLIQKAQMFENTLAFVYTTLNSFRQFHGSFQPTAYKANRSIDHFINYPELLSNLEVRNQNATDLIKEFQYDEGAFIYCDPPYLDKNLHNPYMHKDVNCIEIIKNIMDDPKTKCKIMLHVNFEGYTYDVLQKYMKCYYESSYNASLRANGKKYHKRYQLIACNY